MSTMRDDTDPEYLAQNCVTAMCLEHQRRVWTGGDSREWRHTDNRPCSQNLPAADRG